MTAPFYDENGEQHLVSIETGSASIVVAADADASITELVHELDIAFGEAVDVLNRETLSFSSLGYDRPAIPDGGEP